MRSDHGRLEICRILEELEEHGVVGQVRISDDPAMAFKAAASEPRRIALVALADLVGSLPSLPEPANRDDVNVLVLVRKADVASLRSLPDLPGIGYVGQDELDPDGLAHALSRMAAGEPPVPSWLVQDLLAAWRATGEPARPAPRLTRREQQALVLLVDGLSNKQIGRRLGISDHGAKRLVGNILAKLDCPNRTSVATLAIRDGLYEQCLHQS
ncbi:response regulator transcription factor [Streptomyces odontomachi]|uniref:response regulator transcription factor n=1 Tax=Streptomyces odontomachi TaxID=2944940 RepID=UPI00210B37E4|nr:LuxR C-terminal-related transcriptional regulator [Streptomyces sp. ODS25]